MEIMSSCRRMRKGRRRRSSRRMRRCNPLE